MTTFEKTFDNATSDYDKSRPTYAKEIYEDILRYKPINSDSYVLEIGLGTGKASQPILDTQCHFAGIEPGEQLADLARSRYQAYANFFYSETILSGQPKKRRLPPSYFFRRFIWLSRKAYAATTGTSQPSAFNFLRYALILRSLLN